MASRSSGDAQWIQSWKSVPEERKHLNAVTGSMFRASVNRSAAGDALSFDLVAGWAIAPLLALAEAGGRRCPDLVPQKVPRIISRPQTRAAERSTQPQRRGGL